MSTKLLPALILFLLPFCACAQYGTDIITVPNSNVYIYLGSLPVSNDGNLQKLQVDILGGAWESVSSGQTTFYIANRNTLMIHQISLGGNPAGRFTLHAYNASNGGVEVYLQTNNYTAIAVRSCMLGRGNTQLINNTTSPNPPAGLTEILPLTIINDLISDENGNIAMSNAAVNPAYKLSVNGTVHARQVNVDMNGWSDNVFERGYRLPNLSRVSSYISKNHHLPEMPSEAEVLKSGQNLGEMNRLLLKKVEELTLYLLKQEKRIKILEQQSRSSHQIHLTHKAN